MVILAAVAMGVFLIVNGIYILVKGRIAPRFGRFPESGKVLSFPRRIPPAVFYVASGAAILAVVFSRGKL